MAGQPVNTHSLSKALLSLLFSSRGKLRLALCRLGGLSLQAFLGLWNRLFTILSRCWPSVKGKYYQKRPPITDSNDDTSEYEPDISEPTLSIESYHGSPRKKMGSNLISCSTYPPKLDISSVPQAQSSHTLRPSPQSTVTDYHSYSHSHISLPSIITNDLRPQILEKTESESPVRAEPEGDVVSVKFETFSHSRIRPFVPEGIKRYDRNVKIPKEYTDYRIAPLTTSFDMPNLPAGWTPCFHPEGGLYFFHKDKRVFTDANLYQHEILSRVLSDIEAIEKFLRVHNIRRSSWIDLVLELEQGDDPDTLYYLIDHSNRSVFFLDEFDASNLLIWQEVDGVSTPTHVKHEIETQYWVHCLMFPQSIELSKNLVDELRDIIIHSLGDQIISATSTVPYSVEDLQKMLNLVNSMEKCTDGSFHGSTRVLSCLMFVFVRQRFYNFHGQPCARLERDQSVYEQTQNKRSWLIVSLSPILFFAPEVHLRALEKVWIDGITRTVLWKEFVGKLYDEWQEFTLYGTVLLNANVAFLAIQSVDENHTDSRSLAQIASYTSIAASLGSIILGLLLVRQYRSKGRDVVEATGYLHRRSNKIMGMETLAIMFALPYALLMWGMVSFLVAYLFICFDGSGIYTRFFIGVIWISIASLILCCIWMAWEPLPQSTVDESEPVAKSDAIKKEHLGETVISRPFRISWVWRAIIFRQGSTDSDVTVV